MALTTIEWTATVDKKGFSIPGYTWNPWYGCTKVSEGCANCYAENLMDTRYKKVKWGKGQERVLTGEANWKQPLIWDKDRARSQTRSKVFCASLGDWLDGEVPIEWLARFLLLVDATPNLDWLLLTKRPENWQSRLSAVVLHHLRFGDEIGLRSFSEGWLSGQVPDNVWVGTTVETQGMANKRIPLLMQIPARIRFLSAEPLLTDIDLNQAMYPESSNNRFGYTDGFGCEAMIHWVIVGGESGHKARPCNLDYVRSIVDQCKSANVPVFVKQLGSNPTSDGETLRFPDRDLKGGNIDNFPADLQIRQFPSVIHRADGYSYQ